MNKERFDPDHIDKESMNYLADKIEEFMNELLPRMVIPEEILDEVGDDIHEGIKRSKELVKRLRKGDASVFKDPDDWNSLF